MGNKKISRAPALTGRGARRSRFATPPPFKKPTRPVGVLLHWLKQEFNVDAGWYLPDEQLEKAPTKQLNTSQRRTLWR